MPRDSQGLYTLPAGNPVTPGTLIEAEWANPTMGDIAQALTNSLPRDGSAPMVAPLTLANSTPTNALHATSKAYVDQFAAYASGMPVGGVMSWPSDSIPTGFFKCDGQAISRTTYAALFALIGTTFGSGDGVTTFNVPNLVDQFIRGKGAGRTIGSTQTASLGSHIHPVSDPGHLHTVSDPTHSHPVTTVAHGHGVTDPGHLHGLSEQGATYADGTNTARNFRITGTSNTAAAVTGISIQNAAPTGTAAAAATGLTVGTNTTGISVGAAGGAETVPQNIALNFIIKAIQDSVGPTALTGITTSDSNMISVDNTNPAVPNLLIYANVAFGTVKLDSGGKVPSFLLPSGNQNLLGTFDASTGNNPTEEYPTTTFGNGDTFIVGVDGTIDVYNPATLTTAPTAVTVGNELVWITGSTYNPEGWYYIVATVTSITASQVALTAPSGMSATNVQGGIEELNIIKATYPVTTSILKGNGGTGFAAAVAGTDYLAPIGATTALQKGNGAGELVDAAAGTDYLAPAAIGTTVQPYSSFTALRNADASWTGSQRGTPVADDDGSFNLNAANNFNCTPTGAVSLTFTNAASAAGQSGIIRFTNTGAFAITKAAGTKSNSSFLATISATGTYLIGYYCDGTDVFLCTDGAQS
jgi:microcystin-dependent protein